MAQMFNPVAQFKAFKQGSLDPANPVADKLSEKVPWAEGRKRMLAYEQPEVTAQTSDAVVRQPGGINNANRTTTLSTKGVAAKQLLG